MTKKKYSVLKFGGSSINSKQKLLTACNSLQNEINQGYKTTAVVSAFRGITDLLFKLSQDSNFINDITKEWTGLHGNCDTELSKDYQEEFVNKIMARADYIKKTSESLWAIDELLSMGESYSIRILDKYATNNNIKSKFIDFDQPEFPTIGEGEFGSARINLDATKKKCENQLKLHFNSQDCIIIPGMGCVNLLDGRIRVRRGASDYVATSIAYGLKAERLWILSDVHGIKSADLNIIKDAKTIPYLTVGELLDAGALGAKNTNTTYFLPLSKYCPRETYFAKYDEMNGDKTRITQKETEITVPVKLVAGREVLVYHFEGYDIEEQILAIEKKLSETYDFIRGGGFKKERFFIFFDLSQAPQIHKQIISFKGDFKVTVSKRAIVGIVGEGMKYTKKIIEGLGKALGDINIIYSLDLSKISAGVVLNNDDLTEAIERLYSSFIT